MENNHTAEKSIEASGKVSRRDFISMSVVPGIVATNGSASAAVPVVETDVMITTPDGTCDAAFIHPTTGSHPGVLLWSDAFGLRPAMREIAGRATEHLKGQIMLKNFGVRTFVLVLAVTGLTAFCATLVAAQKKLTEADARALHDNWEAAFLKKNKVALESLISDKLVFVHGNGSTGTKAQTLSLLQGAGGPPAGGGLTAIKLVDSNSACKGCTAAKFFLYPGVTILTGSQALSQGGKTRHETVTEVWAQKRGGRWELTLINASIAIEMLGTAPDQK